jgi:hypothetical protein
MTATEKALNSTMSKLYADMTLARGTAPLYPQLSPLRDRTLVTMWSQQISLMTEALHEWCWNDIYEYIAKFGTISTVIFRRCDDAEYELVAHPQEVVNHAFDSLWVRINDATLQAGHPSDNVETSIEDISESEIRLISHPNYPQFYLRVEVITSVMYQSDDYLVHEFKIKHGGVCKSTDE